MANTWPKQRRIIGTKVSRVDGPAKSTGTAKYSYDINRKDMLHGRILRCPYAHAKLVSIDAAAAEKMPGVKAIHVIAATGKEFLFAGEEVLGLAAETEELAADAIRAVKVKYDILPHHVDEHESVKLGDQANTTGGTRGDVLVSNKDTKGNVEAAIKEADAVVEGIYGVPVIAHQCLEAHGLVAEWDAEGNLTVWASTQAVAGLGIPGQLAGALKVLPAKVKCITHYMGGGFGSKFNPGVEGVTAAELARKAGKPVKLMLDREEEVTTAGTRPSAFGTVKIAGTKDGKITAFQAHCYGTAGVNNSPGVRFNDLPYVYIDSIPNIHKENIVVRVNAAGQRAWRAPGHPQ
ncbi:MAG TPA: molybdopterin cofactor-binding domain-containing protein, partial [Gemmataceae bacterium]|nr:molybdopterin cofactor-binding domain-containing protein [Gemmataceae bacterium]